MSDGEVIKGIEECTKSSESKICGELRREESKEESEQLERSGDMEEKVGGEIRKKFKENGKKNFGVEGQHTRSREAKLEEKQTRKKEVIKVRKDKSEERSNASKSDNWELSYCMNTGYKDYYQENDGMRCKRNRSHGSLQKADSNLSIQDV